MAIQKRVEFIVEADVPAILFGSKTAAEQYIEAIDVMNDVYPLAFDRTGRVYDVVPHGVNAQLVPTGDERTDVERLRQVLVNFLSFVNIEASPSEPLDELLRKSDPFVE